MSWGAQQAVVGLESGWRLVADQPAWDEDTYTLFAHRSALEVAID
jgi:hypothetical protein